MDHREEIKRLAYKITVLLVDALSHHDPHTLDLLYIHPLYLDQIKSWLSVGGFYLIEATPYLYSIWWTYEQD